MRFSARRDIEAPVEHVFAYLTDYATHEATAARRGARVERVERQRAPETHPAWKVEFPYNGRERELSLEVNKHLPNEQLDFDARYQGLDLHSEVELMSLARLRTRLIVKVDLKPRSIKARLVIQSLRIAKNTIQKRFEKRLATLASEIESTFRA